MPREKETEAAVVLEAYQSALDHLHDDVAAMEEALLALDAYRAADDQTAGQQPPIHADVLFANRLRTRAGLLRCVAGAFIEQEPGMTLDAVATRLGTTPRKVRKMMNLQGSSGRTIDRVSDLLLALGTELDFQVERGGAPSTTPGEAGD